MRNPAAVPAALFFLNRTIPYCPAVAKEFERKKKAWQKMLSASPLQQERVCEKSGKRQTAPGSGKLPGAVV